MDSLAFPQELVDHIIDDLEDDPDSLRAVSLTGRRWYRGTRPYLFFSVELGKRDPLERSKQLLKLLQTTPFLVRCIRILKIRHSESSRGLSWLAKSPHFPHLLRKLWGLSTLDIQGPFLGNMLDLEALPAPLLRHLSLCNIANMDADLQRRSNTGACFPLDKIPDPPCALEVEGEHQTPRLELSGCAEALKTLLLCTASSKGGLPFLRPIVLRVGADIEDEEMHAAYKSILDLCSSTVEDYTVLEDPAANEDQWAPPPAALFEFDRFPRLVDLTVHVNYHFYEPENHPVFPLIIQGLRSLPEGRFWRNLDRVLSDSVFSKLEYVNAAEACIPLLLGNMRNISGRRGIVRVEAIDNPETLRSWEDLGLEGNMHDGGTVVE
ncbi:hypothetical protein DFP72DRAFT_882763 [Ephemerocybe angulata]|uniref:F-box domain-containing protein n=1 Tax=Ephemerocybe angulata TaxID=980116 RepID=A0A8H6MD06_9AGAR|nr:hypothetical protein DFP72DRAFT_882763 [Tulosesus angulatus]